MLIEQFVMPVDFSADNIKIGPQQIIYMQPVPGPGFTACSDA